MNYATEEAVPGVFYYARVSRNYLLYYQMRNGTGTAALRYTERIHLENIVSPGKESSTGESREKEKRGTENFRCRWPEGWKRCRQITDEMALVHWWMQPEDLDGNTTPVNKPIS